MRILILGATGHLGNLTAAALAEDRPKLQLKLTSSRTSGVASLRTQFPRAEVLLADWYDLSSLEAAFQGVDKVFVVTPDFLTDEAIVTPNIIEAARNAGGLSQILRLIAIPPGLTREKLAPEFIATRCGANLHVIAKPLLDASGLPVTYINAACWIMFNLPWFIADEVKTNGRIALPRAADASRLWISEGDIAAVAAKILADEASVHVGKEYLVTGTERLDFGQVANLLSRLLGKTIRFDDDDAVLREAMGEHFETLMTYFRHETRDYGGVPVTDAVERLLGRPQVRLEDYLEANRAMFE